MGVLDHLKSVADSITDAANNLKSASMDAVRSMLEEASSAFGDLDSVGYHVTDVEIAVGLPPSLTVYLVKQGTPTDEAFMALAAKYQGRKTAGTLIALVRQADQWANALRWGERRCRMVAVELGLRPAVRLVYAEPSDAAALPGPLAPLDHRLDATSIEQ